MPAINSKDTFEQVKLDPSQEKTILDKVEGKVSKLPKGNYKEIRGITSEELNEIKQKAAEKASKEVVMKTTSDTFIDTTLPTNTLSSDFFSTCPSSANGVESCGAYDNYYRHNILNGDFTVQVLGHAGENSKYTVLHGSTGSSTAKAQRLSTFKQQINTYERYIVDDLEANTFSELVGWASALASFILLVQGFGTGPVGWVAVVATYANALNTFVSFTSAFYATASRLQISKNAAAQLNNATTTHYNMFSLGDANYGSEYVNGF
ncbi:hypothetical protein PAECIP111891_05596 [Paenibacillus allorhizoplanae]|uniref:Uncharacterized protein n=1 Tax=Paenibacillus allorhizoplanae TaxID=2905648 RepID=A0ABM9CVM3_9BACL|nr:hypothetical protein [Paenibacillus allorhizoplanae]CAH1223986.1 hypothetical protein PAECIP111891_05596 [Paenibacillus allorhizoplanae]